MTTRGWSWGPKPAVDRIAKGSLVVAGVFAAMRFAPQWPKQQIVNYVLGDAAPRVDEIDARWAPGTTSAGGVGAASPSRVAEGDDWAREVVFRYVPGTAPRVVAHEPRLADGDYTVEVEIVASGESPARGRERTVVRRHVTLGGGVTSIESGDRGAAMTRTTEDSARQGKEAGQREDEQPEESRRAPFRPARKRRGCT